MEPEMLVLGDMTDPLTPFQKWDLYLQMQILILMCPSPDGDCYEYFAVYVDDLATAIKDPAETCRTLRQTYNFKLKGDGPLDYHPGCAYKQDQDRTLVADPRRY